MSIATRLRKLEGKNALLPIVEAVIYSFFEPSKNGPQKMGALAKFARPPTLPDLSKLSSETDEEFDTRVNAIIERKTTLKALPDPDQEAERKRIEAEIIAANEKAEMRM